MPRLIPDYCQHYPSPWQEIPDDHRCDAKIVLIGEAPGKNEAQRGKPFVGAAGFVLEEWLTKVGLKRTDLYITNTVRIRPPDNVFYALGKEVIQEGITSLHSRLARLADPYVIVPTGDQALNALLGPHGAERRKITDWRGSILSYFTLNSKQVKVIPTIHPAATFKQPISAKFCLADWQRIAEDSRFKELNLPELDLVIDPTESQLSQFLADCSHVWEQGKTCTCPTCQIAANGAPPALAIDVENSMNGEYFKALTCVGFAYRPDQGLTISLRPEDYQTDDELRKAWLWIKQLCSLPIPKVMQNGLTDAFKLHYSGVPVINYYYDLMEMDHALDPNDGGDTERGSEENAGDKAYKLEMRSLKVLTSLHTRVPFYKLEGKLGQHFDWARFLRYNTTDAVVTRMIYGVLWLKLRERGLV